MSQISFHRLSISSVFAAALFTPVLFGAPPAGALAIPAAQAAPAANRVLGSVTAVSATSVTVHTAANGDVTVALTPQTRLLRATPGEKSLKDAAPINPSDLSNGDRVLIMLTASDASQPTASILVAMKHSDIQQADARETADWRQNGVAGIAQSVDPSAATITLKAQTGVGPIVIHTTPSTVFRRYAADSTSFADSKPAALADVHPGDQVRARGPKEENGTAVDAEEVVAGSFSDIAGVVIKTDPAANTITLKNLATKKPITLSLDPTTQLRRLPEGMAQRLAHSKESSSQQGAQSRAQEASAGEHHAYRQHGDAADMLAQAPTTTLDDLKKGDAVLVVASGPGAAKPTAITILSGVEPLLEAPAEASEGVFSASWNLGGGDATAQAAPQR